MAGSVVVPEPNTAAAPASSWSFHAVIWPGWTSPFRQFGERAFVTNGSEGNLHLEGRGMIATSALRHRELLEYGEHVASGARLSTIAPVQNSATTSAFRFAILSPLATR